MIIGSCPYEGCDGPIFIPICDDPPMMERHLCDVCKRPVWTRHSRFDPWSMTEPDFLKEYDVDEATKAITKRERVERCRARAIVRPSPEKGDT